MSVKGDLLAMRDAVETSCELYSDETTEYSVVKHKKYIRWLKAIDYALGAIKGKTGIKDINGKDICKGDYVKITGSNIDKVVQVEYNDNMAAYTVEIYGEWELLYNLLLEGCRLEVGNICPSCKKFYSEVPALSRKDNFTNICPECGMKEAIESMK